ncbi:MAG: hypothetical protein IT371_30025 [Deltaproteobacteria bacterium]|nr:hypothetical protein [Deltaproteobacteria bacterium]
MKGTARVMMVAFWLGACGCGARTGLVAFDGGRDAAPRESGAAVDAEARADARGDAASPDSGSAVLPGFPASVARACALAVSCSPNSVTWMPRTPSACVAAFARRNWYASGLRSDADPLLADRLLSCAARATDCKALSACFGGTLFALSRIVEGGACKGSSVVTSAGSLDCASFGSDCVPLATGMQRAACAKTSCEAMLFTQCRGSQGMHCSAGAAFDFDCAPSGLACVSTPSAQLCRGTGAACSETERPRCTGGLAEYCVGGRLATVDCGQNLLAGACDPTALGTLPCRATGNACNASFAGECAKDGLVVCVDGRKHTVDCRTAGFETCLGPGPGGTPARCGHYL